MRYYNRNGEIVHLAEETKPGPPFSIVLLLRSCTTEDTFHVWPAFFEAI